MTVQAHDAGEPSARDAHHWPRVDAALDSLIDLPPTARLGAIERLAAGDDAFATLLRRLAAELDAPGGRLDVEAAAALGTHGPGSAAARPGAAPATTCADGTLIGPWRITGFLGAGGMGEVYRAARADDQYRQAVALKLVRAGAARAVERFLRERQIVAQLQHPGIARLLDGGIAPDGRPYMAIELVEGEPIVRWCAARGASLSQRLALFEQVAAAVAYAHRNLVVHRDIKPANVLVTAEGQAKLLDFGIARLLDADADDSTRELMLTPAYASPEQLTGARVTTATDVYALGLLLHELLVGRPAMDVTGLPLPMAIQRVASAQPPSPSKAARALRAEGNTAVAPTLLEGDLDAIVAKAVRKEPEARYASVDALVADLQNYRDHKPVQARQGSWSYVTWRTLRRHRVVALAGATSALALVVGSTLALWQARAVERENARVTAVKSYLLQIFRASDPRTASDRPRGQITARELLDLGSTRIDTEFADQPELRVELLGELASVYRELGETERYQALQAQRLALAEARGDDRAVAEAWINRAADDADAGRHGPALSDLAQADAALRHGHLDHGALRANWWLTRAQALPPADMAERTQSLAQAEALFAATDPRHPRRVTTRIEQGLVRYEEHDNEGAVAVYREALQLYAAARDPDDAEAQTLYGNLSDALMNAGRQGEAVAAARAGLDIARRTYGEAHGAYLVPAAHFARLLDMQGDREGAAAMMSHVESLLKKPWNTDAWNAASTRANIAVAEGAGGSVVELAAGFLAEMEQRPIASNSVRNATLLYGQALWQAGRIEMARDMLSKAYAAYAAAEPQGTQTRMRAGELWARFLIGQGEVAQGKAIAQAVLADDAGRRLAHAALAEADLADAALAEGDTEGALAHSAAALQRWQSVRGFRDVRMEAMFQCARARALLAAGDSEGARALAEASLASSLRWDAPQSPAIADARAVLERLQRRH